VKNGDNLTVIYFYIYNYNKSNKKEDNIVKNFIRNMKKNPIDIRKEKKLLKRRIKNYNR